MNSNWKTAILALVLLAGVLGGCASSVKRADDPGKRQAVFSREDVVARDVTISLDKNAQAQLAENLKFSGERLLSTVKQALDAKGLLAKAPDSRLPVVEIIITDIRVRSNFAAIMFGFMAGEDRIAGEVMVRDAGGTELQRFGVTVSYALGGLAGGQDDARMGWLYESFAKEMMNELTGTAGVK